MADAKEVEWEVATLLSMIGMAENFHTMPNAGGLLDQDSLFIHYFMHVADLRRMREQLDKRKAERQSNGQHPRAMGHPTWAR